MLTALAIHAAISVACGGLVYAAFRFKDDDEVVVDTETGRVLHPDEAFGAAAWAFLTWPYQFVRAIGRRDNLTGRAQMK